MPEDFSSGKDLDIQMSSTALAFEGKGGYAGAAIALAEGVISSSRYTDLVIENALKAKEITKTELPEATFGVSALASAIDLDTIRGAMDIGSVDYPYYDKFDQTLFETKKQEVAKQGKTGLGALVALAQEYGYWVLQSHSKSDQISSTVEMAKLINAGTPRIRTCLETVLDNEKMRRIKEVNSKLEGTNSVIWAIEPNKKVGDGTLEDFVNKFVQMKNDPINRYLTFGIDLDLGGLPNEDKSLFEILDILDRNALLPVFLSLSGQEHIENGFRTHLPLGENKEMGKKLGEWMKTRRNREQEIPALVVETSPVQQHVLQDYEKFLQNLKTWITV